MQPGSRLGPYEIVAAIGAGGMGEVYRAKDTRLGRDVAIKVLPPEFASDPERLRRFEQEARAVAALSHPNILALFDVGTHEGSPYLVTELLEGETLRERLQAGPLTPRKAIEVGAEIAQGLAAAHEKGIVHRDLKPGNVFITKDGQVKILDFGLAKLAPPRSPEERAKATTVLEATDAGTVLGTVAYMSPEQVRGQTVDHRTDIFSFGCVLYEMLSGKRAFQKDSAPETMAAILKEEPPDLAEIGTAIPPGLARIVRHCLEKEPSSRFQSARDVSFDLESLSQSTSVTTAPLRVPGGRRRLALVGLGIALLAACAVGLVMWGQKTGRAPVPSFKRITFGRGTLGSARFTPDVQSVVYYAKWKDMSRGDLFVQRLASPDARSLGVRSASVVGTAGGDVAILRSNGTLAQLPLEGGTPRELLKGIDGADWDPSGSRFAIVRTVNGRQRLEYPVGKVLFETTGLEVIETGPLRFSPDGTQIAFVANPNAGPNSPGDFCVVDLSGHKRTLSKGWLTIGSWLCWSTDGNEIWFSASRTGTRLEIHAVTLAGRERLIADLPGSVVLEDIGPDGRVLVSFGQPWRYELRGRMAGDTAERDLSWLDGTCLPTLSPDGSQMIFAELGEGGGVESSTYHWRMDGSIPTRLGSGFPQDASPDWTTALVLIGAGEKSEMKLIPIGAGETRTLPSGPVHGYVQAAWHPDGKRIVINGQDADGKWRLFVQNVAGGLPQPIATLDNQGDLGPFSQDGRFFAARSKKGEPFALYPIDGGETHPIPFLKADEWPLVFSSDGRSLFVLESAILVGIGGYFPEHVLRLDLKTGTREPWLELAPADRAGVLRPWGLALTPNGRFYAYAYVRLLRDLYLVEGLK
ncbi:MAG: protein kinase [Thermoanaerobaculaceae bacterium]|jgi:Tol biopolymer transport system component